MSFSCLSLRRRRALLSALSLALLAVMVPMLTGCGNYYRAQVSSGPSVGTVNLQYHAERGRRFVLHDHAVTVALDAVALTDQGLTGQPVNIPIYHREGRSRVYQPQEALILNELHVYLDAPILATPDGRVLAPYEQIGRVEIINHDTNTTSCISLMATLGAVAGIGFGVLLVMLATKSSCPLVYVVDGDRTLFQGELFPGAVFPALQRDDWLPLVLDRPLDGPLTVKVANELPEREHLDQLELAAVVHPAGSRAALDRTGTPRLLAAPRPPLAAQADGGRDVLGALAAQDNRGYGFDGDLGRDFNRLTLTFARPADVRQAKLVVCGQDSMIKDQAYERLVASFGGWHKTFQREQGRRSAADLRRFQQEQGMLLRVELDTPRGWQAVDSFDFTGSLAKRTLVMPVDLGAARPGETIRLRLTSGTLFWQLDEAALDCSPDTGLRLVRCPAARAADETGRDVAALVADRDGRMVMQERRGQAVTLTFAPPAPAPDQAVSLFLHGNGHYQSLRNYQGLPALGRVYSLQKPGGLARWARLQARDWIKRTQPRTAAAAK